MFGCYSLEAGIFLNKNEGGMDGQGRGEVEEETGKREEKRICGQYKIKIIIVK